MNIDIHSHYVPPAYIELLRRRGADYGRELSKLPSGKESIFGDGRHFPLLPGFYDVDA